MKSAWMIPRLRESPRRLRSRTPWRTIRANRPGFDLERDFRDDAAYHIYGHGTQEPNPHERIMGEPRSGEVFADIGAHIRVHAPAPERELRRPGGPL